MDIKLLGAHNCESESTRIPGILIDDTIVLDAGGLTSSLSFSAQQDIKAILLTHHHYDHIKDIPAIAMNFYLSESSVTVCSIPPVYDALVNHLMNNSLYPNFLERPRKNPAINFVVMELHEAKQVEGYEVLTIPVNHSDLSVGYQLTDSDGKAVFYTGDTGPGLAECWQQISPQLLIIEVTAPDKYRESMSEPGHITPGLLKEELESFRELKGYLPEVVTVHMNPFLEEKIKAEIASVSKELKSPIIPGCEGMQLHI